MWAILWRIIPVIDNRESDINTEIRRMADFPVFISDYLQMTETLYLILYVRISFYFQSLYGGRYGDRPLPKV